MKGIFHRFASRFSYWSGAASTFVLALLVVIVWAVSGPTFNFSGGWQLFINTFTTISTFLMVFLIQNTQNRNSKAMQLKLDELIYASIPARDNFLDIEDLSDEELAELDEQFKKLRAAYKSEPPASVKDLHKKIGTARTHRQIR